MTSEARGQGEAECNLPGEGPSRITSISDPVVNETDGTATFDITCDCPTEVNSKVYWQLNDGTATAGSDYVDASGSIDTVVGGTGEEHYFVVATLIDDGDYEPVDETFELELIIGLVGEQASPSVGPPCFYIDDPIGEATIHSEDPENQPPTAVCQDVTVFLDGSGNGTLTAAEVDDGSSDPDDGPTSPLLLSIDLESFDCGDIGEHTVTLTVDDGLATDECTSTVTVVDEVDPVIMCPANATLDADDSCEATYSGPAATATDNCDPSPAISSSPLLPAMFSGVGDNMITYTATDAEGNSASCDQTVTVQDVTPPVITLNGDAEVTLECAIDDYTEEGATATDNCDPDVPVTVGGDTVDADSPGTYTVTYNASDDSGNDADEVERTVDVEDTIPPVINLFEASTGLWPPNHKYHSFTVDGLVESVDEACEEDLGIDDVVIAEATSDEPEEVPDGDGDGATFDDIVFPDCQSVDVRSERQGVSDGRVYGIVLQANDGFNIGESTFGVEVPHEKNGTAVDSGVSYTAPNCAPVAPARMVSLDEGDGQAEPLQEALAETPTARHAAGDAEGLHLATEETPDAFRLHANRPNPFNPETTIRFDVPQAAYVKLVVYDLLGRQVRVLVDGTRQAGTHEVQFDGGTLPSGQYLYRLDTPQGSFSGSMLLVK